MCLVLQLPCKVSGGYESCNWSYLGRLLLGLYLNWGMFIHFPVLIQPATILNQNWNPKQAKPSQTVFTSLYRPPKERTIICCNSQNQGTSRPLTSATMSLGLYRVILSKVPCEESKYLKDQTPPPLNVVFPVPLDNSITIVFTRWTQRQKQKGGLMRKLGLGDIDTST